MGRGARPDDLLTAPLLLPVVEASQVSDARRQAVDVARRLGFDEVDAGRVALVVTEAATNAVKYGVDALLIVRTLEDELLPGIEVMTLDRGPGMAHPERCLRDGYSTSGSPGTGLGAMSRLADVFDLHSVAGGGTAVLARVWPARRHTSAPPTADIGAVCVPMPRETECGDAWATRPVSGGSLVVVVDGLGH